MAKGLTKRQQQILEFIQEYVQREGYPPSIREIGQWAKISSLRGVTVHLDALARKGCIERSNTPRSIKITHPTYQASSADVVRLPLMGSIAAGAPIYAEDHVEDLIPVPSSMVRNIQDAFLLRVKGDSMTGEGIFPRDLVIVKPQRHANQNDLVAVVIDEEATVKRINYTKSGGVLLMPSNPNYEPIPVSTDKSLIVGRVIGLIRDYDNMAF